jgi:hypothetical protein
MQEARGKEARGSKQRNKARCSKVL